MKTKRVVWTVAFLSITLAAIVMEVVAGIFHPAGTIPWTEYLARYVPWPFQLAAYVILAVWLPFHFWRHDHLRKVAFTAGVREGQGAARANRSTELQEIARNARAYGWEVGHQGISEPPQEVGMSPGNPFVYGHPDDPNRGDVHY